MPAPASSNGDAELPEDIPTSFGITDDAPGNALMRDVVLRFDWASTSAGPIGQWAEPVKQATRLMLLSASPMGVLIGEEALLAHNDAMCDLFGTRHDGSLGKPVAEVFPERDALAEPLRTGVDYKCRYRIITADGETRWCFGAGRAVREETGAIVKLYGVVIDLTSQIAAEDALADSERRFHALVESIPQIVWSADPQARHDYFNSRWNEFTGLDAASVDGATWEKLVHPEDWPRVSERWTECVATGKSYDIEYRFLHHSGQYRWLRVMALPVYGADGEIVRWYGTSTDIEESKSLEMERELVANELDHRIRNLFALVKGLVLLSVREDAASAAFAGQLQRRLSALHKAHEFIRARDPALESAKSVQALARAILAPYDDNGRIVMQGDDATLQEHLVTPLALIFHELATNSAKYGALACDGGLLSLRFLCGSGRIMLTWVEASVTAPDSKNDGGGFGSKFLTQTIERQLKGKFSRALTPEGLCFEMEIPT